MLSSMNRPKDIPIFIDIVVVAIVLPVLAQNGFLAISSFFLL